MRPHESLEISQAVNFVPEDILPHTSSRASLTDMVLASIALAGMLSVALVAPGALLALKFFGIPISVIIPSSAPIWMGTLTIGYMVQVEK